MGLRRLKERTLLGLLVLHSNEVASLDHLTAGLWEDSDLPPVATLQAHLSSSSFRGRPRCRQAAPGGQPGQIRTSCAVLLAEIPA
jgi:hypothetical protein